MSINLNWTKGTPSNSGLYFVAIKLGDAAGVYDFVHWEDGSWKGLEFGQVIAYVDIQTFKNSLDVNWPDEASIHYNSQDLPQNDSDLWSEV